MLLVVDLSSQFIRKQHSENLVWKSSCISKHAPDQSLPDRIHVQLCTFATKHLEFIGPNCCDFASFTTCVEGVLHEG